MRLFALTSLLLVACGNATPDPGGGTGSGTTDTTPPGPTALALSVMYPTDSVVTLSVSGVASVSNRHFGPYQVGVDKVPPGGSIGLVFDPSDAGAAMVCVSAIEDDGKVRGSACTGFQIVATSVTHAQLDVMDSSNH